MPQYKKFQGRNILNIFVAILVQTMTPKRHYKINWPLKTSFVNWQKNVGFCTLEIFLFWSNRYAIQMYTFVLWNRHKFWTIMIVGHTTNLISMGVKGHTRFGCPIPNFNRTISWTRYPKLPKFSREIFYLDFSGLHSYQIRTQEISINMLQYKKGLYF